jgi:hypothetical protein
MESNTSAQQYFGGDLQLASPHFDEESTVLSARPVVPLKDIWETKAKRRSARHLVFGLSILASLILGALGATVIYKQRGQEAAAVIVNAAVPGSGTITPDSAATASATGEAKGEVAKAGPWNGRTPAENKKPEVRVARRVEQPVVSRRVLPVKAEKRQEAPRYETDESEMRRAERVDEWRHRRAAEREAHRDARGRRNRSADDLLRIRDIFEGPRRP